MRAELPKLGTAEVLHGNALDLPLEDESVDLIISSPPYFSLRSYQDEGEHYEGQIGSEETPEQFLEALWAVMAECWRVLKPTGSCWINLGDKYAGSAAGGPPGATSGLGVQRGGRNPHAGAATSALRKPSTGVRQKSLMAMPWRFAIGCIDGKAAPDGQQWILRAEVIWSKPNGLPESVTDRVRRSHEQWFHFTKQGKYFSGIDEIREPHAAVSLQRAMPHRADVKAHEDRHTVDMTKACHPLGKLPGSVWSVPSEPLKVPEELGIDHFAAFPTEWPRKIILGWSPSGVCVECGEGRRPLIRPANDFIMARALTPGEQAECGRLVSSWMDENALRFSDLAPLFLSSNGRLTGAVSNWRNGLSVMRPEQADQIESGFPPLPTRLRELIDAVRPIPAPPQKDRVVDGRTVPGNTANKVVSGSRQVSAGYACACPQPTADTRPAVILDPFGGTGTTAMVAKALGRHGISVDLSRDYCRLAEWRTNDPQEIRDVQAKTYGIKREVPQQIKGQAALFGDD